MCALVAKVIPMALSAKKEDFTVVIPPRIQTPLHALRQLPQRRVNGPVAILVEGASIENGFFGIVSPVICFRLFGGNPCVALAWRCEGGSAKRQHTERYHCFHRHQ